MAGRLLCRRTAVRPSRWYGREQVGAISTRLSDAAGRRRSWRAARPRVRRSSSSTSRRPGSPVGRAPTHSWSAAAGAGADGAFVTRRFLLAPRRRARVAGRRRRCAGRGGCPRQLQRKVLRCAPARDAPLVPSSRVGGRPDAAPRRAPPGAPLLGRSGQLAYRLEAQLLGAMRTGDVPGFEDPHGIFSLSAPATPGRWRRSSSTTGSTCSRSPA